MADVLNCTIREALGSANTRRLRREGKIPAILYGHGKDNVCLSVPVEEVDAAIRHGSQLIELAGAVTESALLSEVQWDPFGANVLHVDLTRVKKGERVQTTVAIELYGIAPGTKEGGSLNHQLHSIEIDCPATAIPDKLELSVNQLEKDQSLTVADLELPEGVKALVDSSEVIVACAEPVEVEQSSEDATAHAEPEVIGRQASDDEEE